MTATVAVLLFTTLGCLQTAIAPVALNGPAERGAGASVATSEVSQVVEVSVVGAEWFSPEDFIATPNFADFVKSEDFATWQLRFEQDF